MYDFAYVLGFRLRYLGVLLWSYPFRGLFYVGFGLCTMVFVRWWYLKCSRMFSWVPSWFLVLIDGLVSLRGF